jgi:hypothetical protein
MNQRIGKLILKLVVLAFAVNLFVSAPVLEAQLRYKKEAVPQLSSEQYEKIQTLHPDSATPVCVILKLHVIRGDLSKVDIVESCGVPDVDQTVSNWVWKTYHYGRNFSGEKSAKVRVNGPIVRSPQARLSWQAWQEVYKADPLKKGTRFTSRFNIVIQHGRITDVQLLTSCGLPLVDQEFRDFIQKRWIAAEGANYNFKTSLFVHRGYYPQ